MIYVVDVANVTHTLSSHVCAMICDACYSFLCILASHLLLVSFIALYFCIPSKICATVSFSLCVRWSIKLELYLSYNNKI